ncbi:MFS transporter [Actinoplanes sp. RD1]|uniref:MFS transporter n=1 Tax=Actinoplanes sp. RD1 TaxID=3064538 RepID=UPI002741EC6F|nr:MFS transporter [Actinoplanes sp. RD1]
MSTGHRAGEPGYRRVCLALFAAGVASFASLYSTQAVLPELAAAYGISTTRSTLSLSLATGGLGVALLVAAVLGDRAGRTRLVKVSLLVSAVLGLACAAAPGWPALLGLRLAQGVALAGLPAVATAYLREELDAGSHARAAGLYIGGTALGGMTGRLLSGWVAEAAGWRWALAAVAVVALVCAGIVVVLLPESRNFVPGGRRLRPAVTDPALLALYAIAACGMGAFVAVYNAIGFRLAAAPYGLDAAALGAIFLVYPAGSASSAVAGRLADRYGRRAVLPAGSLIFAAGIALTLLGPLPWIIAGLAVMTAGFFWVHGVASGWVPVRAHAGGAGGAQAAALYYVAYYAGSSVFGSMAGLGWTAVAALALALVAVTGVLALTLAGTPSARPSRTPSTGTTRAPASTAAGTRR